MNQKGQSLFELLVAVFVVGTVLISLVGLSTRSLTNTSYAEISAIAGRHSEQAREWLRGERDAGWDEFVSRGVQGRDIYWCINNLGWSARRQCGANELLDGVYQREIIFTVVDASTKVEVEINTFWTDPNGRHEANISAVFTNWK